MINFGLIGYGKFGRNYAKVLLNNPHGKLAATCNRSPIKFDEYTENSRYYSDYNDLLSQKDIDCVIVATQPENHFEICSAALKAKKHVICEKPLSVNYDEVCDLIFETKKTNCSFYVNYIHLFDASLPLFLKSFQNISKIEMINGGCGPNRHFSSLIDYGVHEFAILRYYFNNIPFSGFHITSKEKTQFGENFILNGYVGSIPVTIKCGSGAEKRRREIIINDKVWRQDPLENPLQNLLEMVSYQAKHGIRDISTLDLTNVVSADLEKVGCIFK